MAEVTRWDPIPNVNPRQLRFIIDQALCLLAADLNDVLEPALRSLGGDEWHRTLAQEIARPGRRVYDLAKLDLTAYVDLLHSQGWAGRRELRAALMRNGDFRSVSRLLDDVVDIRNAWAHPKRNLDKETARSWLGTMTQCATTLRLAAASDLAEMLRHLLEVASGGPVSAPTPTQVRELELQIAEQRAQMRAMEEERDRSDAEREAFESRATEAEEAARLAKREAGDLRKRQLQLEQQMESADEAVSAQHQLELDELAREQAVVEQRRREADAEAARIDAERKAVEESWEAVAAREADLEARDRELQSRLAEAQATSVRSDDLLERLRALAIPAAASVTSAPEDSEEEALPDPGDPWPYRRGREVWSLSRKQMMYRQSDEVQLSDVLGADRAAQLIDQFLRIRPSGGRVWVDVDGDAATYVGEDLVYLGRLDDGSDNDDGGSGGALVLGTPLPDFRGRKFTVTRSGVTERGSEKTLASVRGAQIAKQVAERLLQVRPKGGTYRVNPEGVAATYVGGQWVFAGKVSSSEWFPGQIR